MKKLLKSVMAVMMSLAMAVCLLATEAGATEVSNHDDEIALQSINIGVPYHNYYYSNGNQVIKLTAQFTNQSTLMITYMDLSGKSRLVEMDVSTSSKTFNQRSYVVKANKTHSETYSINVSNASKVTSMLYPHTSTKPNSGYIGPYKAILQ